MLHNFDSLFQAPAERPLLSPAEIRSLLLHLQVHTEIKFLESLKRGYRN